MQHSALEEDHLHDEDSDREKREHRQGIQNPDYDPPATLLLPLAPPEFVELIGLGHAASPRRCVSLHSRSDSAIPAVLRNRAPSGVPRPSS